MAKKKAFMVMSRNPNVLKSGLKTDKGNLTFKEGKTAMFVGDAALANEIDKVHGLKGTGDVWVHEDPQAEPFLRDDGREGMGVHKYHWGVSAKYAAAWDAFEKRRKDKEENQNEENVEQPETTQARKGQGTKVKQKSASHRTKKYRHSLTVGTAMADEVSNDNS